MLTIAREARADAGQVDDAWTDLACLFHRENINRAYDLEQGQDADCPDDRMVGMQPGQKVTVRQLEPSARLRYGVPGWPARQHPGYRER